jgi:hypothetical protein
LNGSATSAAAASAAAAENTATSTAVTTASAQGLSEDTQSTIAVRQNIAAVVNRHRAAIAAESSVTGNGADSARVAAIAALTRLTESIDAVRIRAGSCDDSAAIDCDIPAVAASPGITGNGAGPPRAPSVAANCAATLGQDSVRNVSRGCDGASTGNIHTATAAAIFAVARYPARAASGTASATGACHTLGQYANRASTACDDGAAAVYCHKSTGTTTCAISAKAARSTSASPVASRTSPTKSEYAVGAQKSARGDVAAGG